MTKMLVRSMFTLLMLTVLAPSGFAAVSAQERARGLVVRTLAGPIEAGSGGLEVDPQGNVYTADFGATLSRGPVGTRVWRVTPVGEVSVFAEGFRGASGNTLGPDGSFYQSNISSSTISRVWPEGHVEPFATEGLRSPVGLVFDTATRFVTVPGGNNGHIVWGNDVLYVVARGNHQIYELTLAGELTLLAGSGERGLDDGPGDTATLSLPNDVALSPDGRILYWNDVGELDPADGQTLTPTWIRYVELSDG